MRRYDVVFIVLSTLPESEIGEMVERYQNMVAERKGLIIKIEKWGKRKLAYEIKKQNMGFYVLFDFAGDSDIVDEVERNLKIDDKVLKFLTVKTAEEITAAEVDQIIAAAAAKEKGAVEETEVAEKAPEAAEMITETKEEEK